MFTRLTWAALTFAVVAASCAPSGDGGTGGAGSAGGSGATWSRTGVTVHLERRFPGGSVISFGLPLPPGAVAGVALLDVRADGRSVPDLGVRALLFEHDAQGAPKGVRSALVQFSSTVMTGSTLDLDVSWSGPGAGAGTASATYASTSTASPEQVRTAVRTITQSGGSYQLTEVSTTDQTLLTGREPFVHAVLPDVDLAATGSLGSQLTAAEVAGDASLAGVKYLSDELASFVRSASYGDGYAYNPASDSVVDPVANYEGWLYDRCATFLTAYAHRRDLAIFRHALRTCSWYAGQIELGATNHGVFRGKPDADTKYSHLRGLYVYYALTGDEVALAAGTAIAEMWRDDAPFVIPYAKGAIRGSDKLWTERLLGTSLEGLYYGHRLTGRTDHLDRFRALLATAHTHITTRDQATLEGIDRSPGYPPQDCFIHNAEQHGEGNASEPWCSGWMSELLIDPLLAYREQTGDTRVDDIFVRLARFLRDTGSAYFRGDVLRDQFLQPSLCFDPANTDDPRILVPLYGSGRFANGTRSFAGDYSDYEHCADATALTAAALQALRRQGTFDAGGPVAPFASEGESFLALHEELSACAVWAFSGWHRTRRDPRNWTSAQLAPGAPDPATFIAENKIGYPSYPSSPQRKLSWWFNTSMLQYGLLGPAGVRVPDLSRAHLVSPTGCR